MIRRYGLFAALLVLTAGALALRVPSLGNRPMHGDEAVHAVKCATLWRSGEYSYDPNEFHGPTIYYAALPSLRLHGRRTFAATQESDYRLPIALFGAAMVLLLAPLADGLGRRAALWSGLLLALSTAFVFYSRYYIQEIPLAFFTLGAIACGWRYARGGRPVWLLAAGLCAGLMAASKETAVVSIVAAGLAIALTAAYTRRVDGRALDLGRLRNGKALGMAALIAVLVAALLVTGTLSHPGAVVDYFRSYAPWMHRAHGTELHRHPTAYYLSLLIGHLRGSHERGPVWSEGLIVGLAAVGLIVALLPAAKSRLEGSAALARFIAFFTIILIAVYSLIPYKTPWCVLSFLTGMILLAGIGAEALVRAAPWRALKAVVAVVLLLGCAQLGSQAYRASFVYYCSADNPYVYAQPVPDITDLAAGVEMLAPFSPRRYAMPVYVVSVDNYYWPLPWYLRKFPNVGYVVGQMPADLSEASVILASPEFEDALTKRLDATHVMKDSYGLRPGVFFDRWVRMDLWRAYIQTRQGIHPAAPGT
jgi:uncharacterized protein (TIGR03663 family)